MEQSLLILDDDAAVASTIRIMAERMALSVEATDSAWAFFEALELRKPTHIALDLVMPRVDGVEVLLELARRGCKAPIIITSGAGSRVLDAARRASTENGLNVLGTLAKPFTFAKFKALMELDGRAGAAEPAPRGGGPSIAEGAVSTHDLEQAIAERQFSLAYQPKIRCADRKVFGFEALARWEHPTKGAIPPATFIPLAEANNLIGDLTDHVLDQALDWLASSFAASPLHLAINLSARSLDDIRLADRLAAAVDARGIDPGRIILELTETSAMVDPLTTLNLATRLRLKGFQLSIDDFGIGYSSLAQLARLPFSELKIDTSFVRPMAASEECRKIVRAMIGLGHSLGLRVTAEGVEDAPSLALLQDMNCDLAQGYHIGRPMTGLAVMAWMAGAFRDAAAQGTAGTFDETVSVAS
ncbi:MAG: EAL domain-containing response regulator [Rhizobiales bacterium]|nr:EAL domain-containing response regulator [Hyphomicrobiales bacterium]